MPGIDEKNGEKDYAIAIVLTDRRTRRAIFEWRPGRGNVALGIRKAAEVATSKLGVDLESEGVVLTSRDKEEVASADH